MSSFYRSLGDHAGDIVSQERPDERALGELTSLLMTIPLSVNVARLRKRS